MKKVLLTASALSLLAGAAAAEVTVGGDARFGVAYNSGTGDTTVHQRYRVRFNASTETDGGLTFGAGVQLDSRNDHGAVTGAGRGSTLNPNITVSGNGFDFVLGDANGAVVDTVGLWAGGLGFDGTVGRPAIVGGFDTDEALDQQTVKFGYSFGDFSVALSTNIGASADQDIEIAGAYSANGIRGAVGADDAGNYAVSGSYAAGDYKVGAIYADAGAAVYRVYGTYSFGATTVGLNVTDANGANIAFGIGASHNLGGGVVAHGAAGRDTAGDTVVQVGMTMGF